jgi:transcriptional regulator GlxA family with amidase domain
MMRVACLIYDGFLLLDAAGPIAAFELTVRAGAEGYSVQTFAATSGSVRSSCGTTLTVEAFNGGAGFDTVIVPGGYGAEEPHRYRKLIPLLQSAARKGCRIVSVCTGAFVLAEAGLLDGKQAATHWNHAAELSRRYPLIKVDPESLFVRDGNVWTSAGATSGIDLTLVLIENDYGSDVARRVSQQLVVPFRRAGTQSQHAALLKTAAPSSRFNDLLVWARMNLDQPLTVEQLAERANLSVRQFSRSFQASVGRSPASAIERLRIDTANTEVIAGVKPIDQIARDYGFGNAGRMTRAFRRVVGETPQAIRRQALLDDDQRRTS